ncbi:MAG: right-handed parallel beta-helix repeat-containing protein [Thermodesulfobacteriota bacterium]
MLKNALHCFAGVLICLGLLAPVLVQPVEAQTWYVSPDGDDGNPGTAREPWKTPAMAARQARPGDTVTIGGGIYPAMLEITRSGAPGAIIVFQGSPDNPPVIDAAGRRHGVILWNASHVCIRGLVVRNSLRNGIHLHDHLDAEDHGADYNVIEGNTIQNCGLDGYSGIYVGGHHNRIEGNRILENGRNRTGTGEDGHGVYILGNDNEVRANQVSGNARVGIRMEGDRNRIERNRLLENGDFGLSVWVDPPLTCSDTIISGNDFENNLRGGISLYGQGQGGKPQRIHIAGNRLHHVTADCGIRLMAGVRQVRINLNRIIGRYEDGFLIVEKGAASGYSETNNLFCGKGAFVYLDREYSSFSQYRAASGQGKGSRRIMSEQPADCQ